MTERAKKAAEELIRRGWQLELEDAALPDKACVQCGQLISADSCYCSYCGTKVIIGISSTMLEDIEAAIATAVNNI